METLVDEVWAPVVGYEELYQVSNMGRARNRYKFLKPWPVGRKGRTYHAITLSKSNVQKVGKLHRLVAIAFLPNPDGLRDVNHKDHNKFNNRVDNLEWCSESHNRRHAYRKEFALRNMVSDLTWEKLVNAGWQGERPDVQEIADQLPSLDGDATPRLNVARFEDYNRGKRYAASYLWVGNVIEVRNDVSLHAEADTMAEALALLWLKLQETIPNGTSSVQTVDESDDDAGELAASDR